MADAGWLGSQRTSLIEGPGPHASGRGRTARPLLRCSRDATLRCGPADGVRPTGRQLALAATRELAVMRCPEEGLSGGIAIDGESPIVGDERFSSPVSRRSTPCSPRATRTCPSPHGSIPCCPRAKVRRCSAHRLGRRVSSQGRKQVGLLLPGVRDERGTSCERSPRRVRRPSAYWGNS